MDDLYEIVNIETGRVQARGQRWPHARAREVLKQMRLSRYGKAFKLRRVKAVKQEIVNV